MPVLLMLTCKHAYMLITVGLLVVLYIGLIYVYQIAFVALLSVLNPIYDVYLHIYKHPMLCKPLFQDLLNECFMCIISLCLYANLSR